MVCWRSGNVSQVFRIPESLSALLGPIHGVAASGVGFLGGTALQLPPRAGGWGVQMARAPGACHFPSSQHKPRQGPRPPTASPTAFFFSLENARQFHDVCWFRDSKVKTKTAPPHGGRNVLYRGYRRYKRYRRYKSYIKL